MSEAPPSHTGTGDAASSPSPPPSPAFSFIVPVKNQLAMTRGLIESTQDTNPGCRVEWIIVDSGSTDGTREYCERAGARVLPFRSDPFNYCAAINTGAAAATGRLWVIANNDLEMRSTGD
ncbi:MAG TPA: glycosyltransferase family 2 protein, partial [Armatimonadota bacterium]|nr:glycosyltransferase family 2 protein [Armatimonadota bacterium]